MIAYSYPHLQTIGAAITLVTNANEDINEYADVFEPTKNEECIVFRRTDLSRYYDDIQSKKHMQSIRAEFRRNFSKKVPQFHKPFYNNRQ